MAARSDLRYCPKTGSSSPSDVGGDSRLIVTKSTTGPADQATKASWRVDDIAGEVAELRARGVRIEDLPELNTVDGIGFALAAWFTDPHHNSIGLLQLK